MDRIETLKKQAQTEDTYLTDCYNKIAGSLLDFCIHLSIFRERKLHYVLNYENFEDYCKKKFKLSHANSVRYSVVGNFIRSFKPKDIMQMSFVTTNNLENLGISKLYILACCYFRHYDVFEQLCSLDVCAMTCDELREEVEKWMSLYVVKKDIEYSGDVQELRDSIETVANDISAEKIAQTSVSSAAYDDNTKTYINGVMALRAECERLYRFLESISDSDTFKRCTFYDMLSELIRSCDDDLNNFMG